MRLKESDRLKATVDILNALGGNARIEGEDIVITGVKQLRGGVTVDTVKDHRMVMLASIAALDAAAPVTLNDIASIRKSWPEYFTVYESLGGRIE